MALLPTSYAAGASGHLSHSAQIAKKLNVTFDVKADYNATGDGSTDDTTAIQNAIDAAEVAGGNVFFPPGTFITQSLTIGANNVRLLGAGAVLTTIKAKAATDFENVIYATGRTGVEVRDLTVDINQVNRAASLTTRANGINLNSCADAVVADCVVKNGLGYSSGVTTGVAILLGGTGSRKLVENCVLLDCGTSAKPCDGVFISGDHCLIQSCRANACTDTAFVLETANYSGIADCAAVGCKSGAAITNASADDKVDNFINGLSVYNWDASVTGGIQIGNPSAATVGHLRGTVVANVVIERTSGTGPAINVRRTGTARTIGLTFTNVKIRGASTQGILLAAEEVLIVGCAIEACTDASIQANTNSLKVRIDSCLIQGSVRGVHVADGVNDVTVANCTIIGDGTTTHGVYWFGTCTGAVAQWNEISSAGTARIGSDGGTTPIVMERMSGTTSGLTFGAAADTNLYRIAANRLYTDDQFTAADGIVLKSVAGAVSDANFTIDTDGIVAYDSTNHKLYVRSGGTWRATAALT